MGNTGAAPKPLPRRLFSARADGTFTNKGQRFAYDGATGALYYDADGSGTSNARQIVAILAHHPILAATDLFFVS